jgi:hypothetical protein
MNGRYNNNRNNGYSQGNGYQGNGGGQRSNNVRGAYKPNTGQAKPNERRRGPNDPAFNGVGNFVTPDGQTHTFWVKVWENENGTLGLAFDDVNNSQQRPGGQRGQGNYQQPRQNGGNNYQPRQNGGYSAPQQQGNYAPYPQDWQGQDRPQNGAMSRARPIPQPHYDDSPPPYDAYPDGPVEPGGYEPDMGQ